MTATTTPALTIQHLYKRYDDNDDYVLSDINLVVHEGEIIAISGKNGCGKSTLLRIICGLEKPSKGFCYFYQEPIERPTRKIFLVQQSLEQLMPWLTAQKNVLFPMRFSNKTKAERISEAGNLLELVGITQENYSKFPYQLSGGQRQRVSIARALAANPRILLLDESFSALDENTRSNIYPILRTIIMANKCIAILIVSHHLGELNSIVDNVVRL